MKRLDVDQDIDLVKAGLGIKNKRVITREELMQKGYSNEYDVKEALMDKGIFDAHQNDRIYHEIIIDMIIYAIYESEQCSKTSLHENYIPDHVYIANDREEIKNKILSDFKPREDEIPSEYFDQLDLEDLMNGDFWLYDIRTNQPNELMIKSFSDGDYSDMFETKTNEIIFYDRSEDYFYLKNA